MAFPQKWLYWFSVGNQRWKASEELCHMPTQRAFLVLLWFCGRTFQPHLTRTKSTIREPTQYELCCKYQIHKVHVWVGLLYGTRIIPPEQFIISCFELTTKTKTFEQPSSLIVPLRTSRLVSLHSTSTYHDRWVRWTKKIECWHHYYMAKLAYFSLTHFFSTLLFPQDATGFSWLCAKCP